MTDATTEETWDWKLPRPSVSPYLKMREAVAAIEFYKTAFGARELNRHEENGRLMHAEIEIGATRIMLTDGGSKYPELPSAGERGESPVSLFLYVADADATQTRALSAGATEVMPLQDKDYGRAGGVRDPFGITWWICS